MHILTIEVVFDEIDISMVIVILSLPPFYPIILLHQLIIHPIIRKLI